MHAEIMATIIVNATSNRLTPENVTPNTRHPTTNPHTDAHTANKVGNTPLANIRESLEQGAAMMERILP